MENSFKMLSYSELLMSQKSADRKYSIFVDQSILRSSTQIEKKELETVSLPSQRNVFDMEMESEETT